MTDLPQIQHRDRLTGEICIEPQTRAGFLGWFACRKYVLVLFDLLLNNPAFSKLYGLWQRLPASRRRILPFVTNFDIDLSEVEYPLEHYRCFNAFFTRRLTPSARPFVPDPDVLCAPSDGKVLVYPHLANADRLPIKGAELSLSELLACEPSRSIYEGGSALIVRLAPYDYHWFHFPVDGNAKPARDIPGRYYSVNPVFLSRVPDLLGRNKRSITEFATEGFGRIAQLEIGALAVASIVQIFAPGPVGRGQPKGYFQFGGSTLVLLFEPDRIVFDNDLLLDSAEDLEVQVKAGSAIGRRA